MRLSRKEIGSFGEGQAISFLQGKGYRIIERNYKLRIGEIDIIADDRGVICLIEVKTRNSEEFGSPKEAVCFQKQRKLSRLALAYLQQQGKSDCPVRFDVVSIVQSKQGNPKIELIQNAFDYIGN